MTDPMAKCEACDWTRLINNRGIYICHNKVCAHYLLDLLTVVYEGKLPSLPPACPVLATVEVDDLENILTTAMICAEDLQHQIDHEYKHQMEYPSGKRRHARDSEPAVKMMLLILAMRLKYGMPIE